MSNDYLCHQLECLGIYRYVLQIVIILHIFYLKKYFYLDIDLDNIANNQNKSLLNLPEKVAALCNFEKSEISSLNFDKN